LHSTVLLDLHLDASHILPSVMPIAAPRSTRARPLWLQLPKPNPASVADVRPDHDPFAAPPTLLTAAAS